jgi:hypothetical protein
MPKSPFTNLTPDQRFQQIAAILPHGAIRHQRRLRRSNHDLTKNPPSRLPVALRFPEKRGLVCLVVSVVNTTEIRRFSMKLDIDREVAVLEGMSTGQLCERYAKLFGQPVRTRHRGYLIRKIAWRLQALAEGDLTERARRRAGQLAEDADVRVMPPRSAALWQPTSIKVQTTVTSDPRLPAPGIAIVRNYKGPMLRVLVLSDGFEYNGERYKSLSAVAKAITGSHCNGFRFFELENAK